MKVKIPGTQINPTISSSNIKLTFTSPLLLNNIETETKDTISKSEVDTIFVSLNANSLTTGILAVERLPGQTGDVSNISGTNLFTIKDSGVFQGTYEKVTVDTKGRIINNELLVATDIPDLDWSKINKNKPTTLTGYGVTDGIKRAGDTVINGLISSIAPVNDLHAATKEYTDIIANADSIKPGTVVSIPADILAGGFLRANGGEVSKTTYPNLYAIIGDSFSPSNQIPGSGKPWKQQYAINAEQNADITGWIASAHLPEVLYASQTVVTKNRIYLISGRNSTGATVSTVYTTTINTDGTLGTWVTSDSLPGGLSRSQAIVTKNRVYLLGGNNGSSWVSTVYTASINTDGTLGTWTTGTDLPGILAASQAITTKNRVYLLGGYNGTTHVATVYTAPINSDGTLGEWITFTNLPEVLCWTQAIVTQNRVYLLGGEIIGGVFISTAYTASIDKDGILGNWTTGNNLPEVSGYSQAVVTKNRVYLLGGRNAIGYTSSVYTATVNTDGSLGSWTRSTSLPGALAFSQAVVIKNKVYLLGGWNTSGQVSTVHSASILGGLNDYSPYYDGTVTPLIPITGFRLPDYSYLETATEKYFIKY